MEGAGWGALSRTCMWTAAGLVFMFRVGDRTTRARRPQNRTRAHEDAGIRRLERRRVWSSTGGPGRSRRVICRARRWAARAAPALPPSHRRNAQRPPCRTRCPRHGGRARHRVGIIVVVDDGSTVLRRLLELLSVVDESDPSHTRSRATASRAHHRERGRVRARTRTRTAPAPGRGGSSRPHAFASRATQSPRNTPSSS